MIKDRLSNRSFLWPRCLPRKDCHLDPPVAHFQHQEALRGLGEDTDRSSGYLLPRYYPRKSLHLQACGEILESRTPGHLLEYERHIHQ
jgi:hypothetical protein